MSTPSAGESRGLTGVQWLICIIAAIGFAFDIYELLMLPLVALAIWIGVRPTDFTRKAEPGLALVSQRVLEAQQVRTASLTNESPLTEGVAAR